MRTPVEMATGKTDSDTVQRSHRTIILQPGPAVFAVKPGDSDNQFDLSISNRQHLERAVMSTKPDNIDGFAVGTLQVVGVNRAVVNGLCVKKVTFLYCTAEIPKV